MLRSTHELQDYTMGASDGPIGRVSDVYFDDDAWVVRYLVVDTGSWLASRLVLISPMAIGHPDRAGRLLPLRITREQVRNSPDIDTSRTVSRQHEVAYLGYYGYPSYWEGGGLWGAGLYPNLMLPDDVIRGADRAEREREDAVQLRAERERQRSDDPHLRSCKAVTGYRIHANDGEIGHVDDLLVDEDTWAIRYLVINTSNWWVGHQVLVAPHWITGVSWDERSVSVDLTRHAIQDAPPFESAGALNREREISLHAFHGRAGYWAGALPAEPRA